MDQLPASTADTADTERRTEAPPVVNLEPLAMPSDDIDTTMRLPHPLIPQHFAPSRRQQGPPVRSPHLRPRLIDIDPMLLSNLELEVLFHVPIDAFPRKYLLRLASLAANHFIQSGRYPGWGARFDVLTDHSGKVAGASYRFEGCICGSCDGRLDGSKRGFISCRYPEEMRRY